MQSKIVLASLARCALAGAAPKAFFDQRSPTQKEDANMTKTLLSKAMTFLPLLLLASVLHAQADDVTTANKGTDPGVSKVRIVRLSQVRGTVQIDRSNLRGFEPAIANLPIIERNQLQTGVGIAEVEFEDNSSLRLAPNSLVEFPKLERDASGATISSVHIIKGSAYISLVKPESGKAPVNKFVVVFGDRKIELDPATHVRLTLADTDAKLAVLDGVVHVSGENGSVSIPKKKTATFAMFSENEPTIAKDVEPTPFDAWDHNAASYHSNVASLRGVNSPYAYGTNDMAYYGSFVNAGGGCGSMWRPYFASASWQPYSNGSWAYYQGAGYSWVSPYPWAWTPYHSGSWAYCNNVGWGWMPGGGWNGLNNVSSAMVPSSANTSAGNGGIGRIPHQPTLPPAPHSPTVIAVNTKPLTGSEIASSTSFVFRKDSAGLGVPRGTLGDLHKFSNESISKGTATMPIFASVPQTNRSNGALTTSETMGISIHRGYAPSASNYSQGSSSSFGGSNSSGMGSSGGGRSSAGPMPSAPAPSAPASGGVKR
jgi:Family of unknown function (DUF6600)/FecR protein